MQQQEVRVLFRGSPAPIEEMKKQRVPGTLERLILAAVPKIPAGESWEVIGIKRNHFQSKVTDLKIAGKLGRDFGVISTKTGGFALAHYAEERPLQARRTRVLTH